MTPQEEAREAITLIRAIVRTTILDDTAKARMIHEVIFSASGLLIVRNDCVLVAPLFKSKCHPIPLPAEIAANLETL